MKARIALLVCLVGFAALQVQAAPSAPIENSEFIGDQCPVPNTAPSSSASGRGVASPRPPDRRTAAAVAGFLAALRHRDERGLLRWSIDSSAGTAPACMAGLRRLALSCTPEPPYVIDNGSVRIAWECNGLVSYDSFFVVVDGKIADVDGLDATQPIVALPAPSADTSLRKAR